MDTLSNLFEETVYADKPEAKQLYLPYKVKFINENGVTLIKGFQSPYFAKNFVNKLKRSKKCILLSYPNID